MRTIVAVFQGLAGPGVIKQVPFVQAGDEIESVQVITAGSFGYKNVTGNFGSVAPDHFMIAQADGDLSGLTLLATLTRRQGE